MFSIQSSLPRLSSRSCDTIKLCRQVRWAGVKHRRGEVGRPPKVKAHWTPEKLAVDDGYPLTAALNDKIHPAKQSKVSKSGKKVSPRAKSAGHHDVPGVFVRTQIVSPELCDDILSYIGPSLAVHKGCDILDINPGACLWSQKLHQYLQPRSHVLLEPNYDTFKDFIDPLLQAPKSKYKLVDKDPRTLDSYRQIIDEGVFPHQTRVDRSDPEAPTLNRTLLVTGSLSWDPRLPGLGFDSMAKQLFHHFATAAWNHDLFHAYGPVRTLLWVPNDDFNPVIAHAINGVQKANRHLEMIHELNLVVGAERQGRTSGKQTNTREPGPEIESLIRALKAGESNGLELPSHRRDFTYDVAKHIDAISGGTGVTRLRAMQEYLNDLQREGTIPIGLAGDTTIANIEREMELKQMYPGINFETNAAELDRRRSQTQFRDMSPANWKEITDFKKVRSSIMNITRNKEKVEEVVDVGENLYLHEIKALSLPEGPEYDALLKRVDELDKEYEEKVANLDPYYRGAASLWIDERLNLRYPPGPRIQWDQRPFEPMIMHEKEVWPRHRLALVMATPKSKPQGLPADSAEWMQDFIYGLYSDPALPLATALDTMQHGLSDIMKDCTSLRDPKVGGRLQMKHIRVRMLTTAMLTELVQVYRDWPFKEPGSDHNKYFRHKAQGYGVARGPS